MQGNPIKTAAIFFINQKTIIWGIFQAFQPQCKKILTRLYRVFVHVYVHHFDRIMSIGKHEFSKRFHWYRDNLFKNWGRRKRTYRYCWSKLFFRAPIALLTIIVLALLNGAVPWSAAYTIFGSALNFCVLVSSIRPLLFCYNEKYQYLKSVFIIAIVKLL